MHYILWFSALKKTLHFIFTTADPSCIRQTSLQWKYLSQESAAEFMKDEYSNKYYQCRLTFKVIRIKFTDGFETKLGQL